MVSGKYLTNPSLRLGLVSRLGFQLGLGESGCILALPEMFIDLDSVNENIEGIHSIRAHCISISTIATFRKKSANTMTTSLPKFYHLSKFTRDRSSDFLLLQVIYTLVNIILLP